MEVSFKLEKYSKKTLFYSRLTGNWKDDFCKIIAKNYSCLRLDRVDKWAFGDSDYQVVLDAVRTGMDHWQFME